ncbi:MAG TPA: hypothetical protein VE046_18950 [Steroidobacteraceae bacterium]|nr:hypothetical protein [Steroidobacteraceae bacterium]
MSEAAQKKRIRRSALTWTLVALAFFFGFIAMAVYRARSHA